MKTDAKYMNFNDTRLEKRFEKILDAFVDNPEASIPESCQSNAATKAAYRFFSNEDVEAISIRKGSRNAAIDRMLQLEKGSVILFPADSTNLVYSSHKKLRGIGVLRSQRAKGLNLHTTLAVTESELILGSIEQVCWGRKPEEYGKRALRRNLPIQQKESYRWLESFNSAQDALPEGMRGIFLGDRGADIYELFLEPRISSMDLLIRASHKRFSTQSPEPIFAELEASNRAGVMSVNVERSGNRKARVAELEIRFKTVDICPPKNKRDLPLITLSIVSAKEIHADDIEDVIHWKLLTTLPINSLEDAKLVVRTYAKRWIIERFHYALKEGCKVEELQLEAADRIDKAVATYTIVACRLMHITYLSRTAPETPCTDIFSAPEWKSMWCYMNKKSTPPPTAPSMREFVMILGKAGGFLGRKSDGFPGVKVVWRGLRIMESTSQMYSILRESCG